jgi:hypothetical protein
MPYRAFTSSSKAQKKWLAGAAANHLSKSACAAFGREQAEASSATP